MQEIINNNIIYFELNHWSTEYYPDEEPFISWMSDYYETKEEEEKSWIRESKFLDKYCKNNELVMVVTLVDMSVNFCVSAKKEWIEKHCPALLTKYTKFLRVDSINPKDVPNGQFGSPFLEYTEENIGAHYYAKNIDTGEYYEP